MAATLRNQNLSVGIVNAQNWEDILRKNYMKLTRIRPLYIVNFLYQSRVLSEEDKEDVESHQTPHRQATCLMDMLSTKGFANFVVFLGVLENEYPEIFEDITDKKAVRRPGYEPKDHRRTAVFDVLPAVLKQLRSEMHNSKAHQESLQKLQQSIDILKEEKAELEVDLERYRMELADLPQLRRDLKFLAHQNQDYKNQILKLSQRCLGYVSEKEGVERRCRELQDDLQQLKKEMEEVKVQRDTANRKTIKMEHICKNLQKEPSVDYTQPPQEGEGLTPRARQYLEAEIDTLKESERELAEKNEELAMNLWETTERVERLQKELRIISEENKKRTEALKNAEENLENLQQRCNDTYFQVDQLRIEKDKAIQGQNDYLDLYKKVSDARDSLSAQCRTLQSQYDNTKKQLDKLKQEMRSSLKSSSGSGEAGNLNYSISQWIKDLEDPQLLYSGSSSSGVSDDFRSLPPPNKPLVREEPPPAEGWIGCGADARTAWRDRSDTVSPAVGDVQSPDLYTDADGEELRDRRPFLLKYHRRYAVRRRINHMWECGICDQYDEVVPPQSSSSTGKFIIRAPEPGCKVPQSPVGEGPGHASEFYVRCNQDCYPTTQDELAYCAGDILLVTDSSKKDCWFARRVNSETGQLVHVSIGKKHEGMVRLQPSREDKGSERGRTVGTPHTIERHGAIKGRKSAEKDPFTPVVLENASKTKRPVMLAGFGCTDGVVSALVSTYKGKYESLFKDRTDVQKKLQSLTRKNCHVILPPGSLKKCYGAKVYPICVVMEQEPEDSDSMEQHLAGTLETTSQERDPNSQQHVEEIRSTAASYSTVTLSKSAISKREDLLEVLVQKIDHLQECVVWRPQEQNNA